MASSPDDRFSHASSTMQQRIVAQFQGDWVDRLSVEQMFILIDGILPFEACLYYQVLPLFIEGNRLSLGMVSPEDTTASEYVRRIVSYLNYSLVSRKITSNALQVVLTAYLNYIGEKQAAAKRQEPFSYGHSRHPTRAKVNANLDPNDRKTLILDSSDDLLLDMNGGVPSDPVSPPAIDRSPQPPREEVLPRLSAQSLRKTPPAMFSKTMPILTLSASHLTSSVDVLMALPPSALLQELMARVLIGGIGRLYFEAHAHHGRVLWSQNGVLQSVMERLPVPLFQGLLNELKGMTSLALDPVSQCVQTEKEYLYDRTRVLLRFRFMHSTHGEEATLQVLRGAALKFYQQQQVAKLERDALGIAKQLQNKLREIRDRADSAPGLTRTTFEILPRLSQLLQTMEEEIDELGKPS